MFDEKLQIVIWTHLITFELRIVTRKGERFNDQLLKALFFTRIIPSIEGV